MKLTIEEDRIYPVIVNFPEKVKTMLSISDNIVLKFYDNNGFNYEAPIPYKSRTFYLEYVQLQEQDILHISYEKECITISSEVGSKAFGDMIKQIKNHPILNLKLQIISLRI